MADAGSTVEMLVGQNPELMGLGRCASALSVPGTSPDRNPSTSEIAGTPLVPNTLRKSYPYTNRIGIVFIKKYLASYMNIRHNFNDTSVFERILNEAEEEIKERLLSLKETHPQPFLEACSLLSQAYIVRPRGFLAEDDDDEEERKERKRDIIAYALTEYLDCL